MSKAMDLAERIAARVVEKHGDVLLGFCPLGEHVVFCDRDAAVLALARDIREELARPESVAIRHVGTRTSRPRSGRGR